MEFPRSWRVTVSSGGAPVLFKQGSTFPAVVSKDGTHTVVLLSYQIRVYYNATRQCVRVVNLDIHDAIAAHMDNDNDSQIIVATSKQRILYVNWKENVAHPVVAKQLITPSIPKLHDVFMIDEANYYAVGLVGEQAFTTDYSAKTLCLYQIDKETAKSTPVLTVHGVYRYAVSRSSNYLAILQKGQVSVYDLKVGVSLMKRTETENGSTSASIQDVLEQGKLTMTYSGPPASIIAISDQALVAIASSHGPIYLVYPQERDRKESKDDSSNQRAFKWHFDGVSALTFSADQRYLISGGTEKVLVIWNLESGKTQFLPRLSGSITAISIDPHRQDQYNIMLSPISTGNGAVNEDQSDILVVSAVDLVSRLAVAPCRPQMASSTANYRRKVRQYLKKKKEALEEDDSDSDSGNEDEEPVKRSKAKDLEDFSLIKPDITASTLVHPQTNQLYLPNGSTIQAFDLVRGEQAFVQHVAPQLDIGRVKSELKIADPQVEKVVFTHDGNWMCTFDSMPKYDLDNLLSKNDTSFALKFWSWSKDDSRWHLASKIVDPHGPGLAVGALVASPVSDSVATVDSNGGIRLWRPRPAAVHTNSRKQQTAATKSQTVWTLRRAISASASVSAPVAAAWAPDSSLLIVSHNTQVKAYDPQSLEPVDFPLPRLSAPVEYLAIMKTHLILASATSLLSFDLVGGCESSLGAKLLDYGARNLIATDVQRNLVAVAVNQASSYEGQGSKSKILVFQPGTLTPIHEETHKQLIVSLSTSSSGFVLVDSATRAITISPVTRDLGASDDLVDQMHNLLVSAQAAANVLHSRSVDNAANAVHTDEIDDSNKWTSHRLVDLTTIEPVFANVDGMALDTLFERVVRAVQ
ncbi:hypothetical protein FT663_05222 [Candidozyma haemuli var. vulneris]|uniref:Uncharacterized protein n=1 Tax=Candidozyma haemuli TaxID=45357 RepID=A0A2V1ATU3_9ASCO|nr:hypothetical protein CXQ85_000219 [[Candida] haemuloni]KAF3985626.1 hypothetical protein FT663_05222 [[Candida] haemuloni var. vulneris]KAF3992665.1 hypothetical protein FT662_01046 [[Candida] haemuloni var. vulneris]PVH21249.1 hypothetical protein CXQ85_000219 [[Candida] haemuloni]